MVLFVLHKLILQTCMRSHPVGLGVWFLVRPFVCFHISCMRTAKALARLRGCSGETARMRRLAWAFASRLCDKYHNLMKVARMFMYTVPAWFLKLDRMWIFFIVLLIIAVSSTLCRANWKRAEGPFSRTTIVRNTIKDNYLGNKIVRQKKVCIKIDLCWGHLSHIMRKPVYTICKQQRCRSACASGQSDQCLCSSLLR